VRSLILACACIAATAAAGENPDRVNRARSHYEAGRALYTLGNYEQALREFVAGYQLSPRPEFLLNAGQSLRRLERLDEAQAMFEKYLQEAPPDDPNRAQVSQLIAEIAHHRTELRATAPPAPVAASAPAAAPASVAVTESAPPKKSFARRHWWIFPVTGVVLAGVAVGLYFGLRPGVDCGATPLGCVDATHAVK
jgi:tetratricopeptide (TPR) repeat protein